MADLLLPRSPFAGLLKPGVHGRTGTNGVRIRDMSDRPVHVITGGLADTAPACRPLGEGWLVVTAPAQGVWIGDRAEGAPPALDGAALTDLTGSRAMLRLEGPAWRDVLSAFVPLDLHATAFAEGAAAATIAGYMPLMLWRPAGLDGVEIATYRSFAGSFWHMVERASEPVGFTV